MTVIHSTYRNKLWKATQDWRRREGHCPYCQLCRAYVERMPIERHVIEGHLILTYYEWTGKARDLPPGSRPRYFCRQCKQEARNLRKMRRHFVISPRCYKNFIVENVLLGM